MKFIQVIQRSALFLTTLIVLSISTLAVAQVEESPPKEPPYTRDENEFSTTPSLEPNSSGNQGSNLDSELGKALSESEKSAPIKPPSVNNETESKFKPGSPGSKQRSSKSEVQYIEHPQSTKGLLRIEKDGTYVYYVPDDKVYKNVTGTLRVGGIDAPKIFAQDGATNFQTMYQGSPVPYLMYDYEWQPFTSFGRLGIQAGIGFLVSHGSGRFACTNCGTLNGTQAQEKYTFLATPLSLGVVYRIEWLPHQWISPYASGGGVYVPVIELRDDNSSFHPAGTAGAYGAGGLMFNITAVDKDTAFVLKKEYDIKNLWLTAEFRYLKTFNADLDFSSNILSLGIGIDY